MVASAKSTSRKARIGNIVQYPALFFAKLAQGRLEKHWGQTYAVIAVVSNAFIGLTTLVIVPRLLPTSSLAFLVVAPIFSPLILIEYGIFRNRIHRKTVDLYDSAPCQLKLTILRVHEKRKLLTAATFASNFAFSLYALYGASVALFTAGLPYYITVNASYLLGFRLSSDKELKAVFEAVPQLRTLPEFYQTMSIRLLKDRIKRMIKQQVPLAGEINPDPFIRAFYLENVISRQPSPIAVQRSNDLKNALAQNGDLLGVLNQGYPQSVTVTDAVKFNLPWEKRFNWGRFGLVVLSAVEALAALYTLQVFGIIGALAKIFVH